MTVMLAWKARTTVLAVLVLGMALSSIDRVAMSVAIPFIGKDLELSATAMGAVMSAFFASYALMQIPGGLFAHRFGVRKVASIALVWWSIFTGITGAAANLVQLLAVRFVFGLGEGVFPPSCFATVAMWFPKRERGSASAMLLAATLLGSAVAPLVVVAIISKLGWRAVFYCLLVPGLLMAILFWKVVADRPSLSKSIRDDELAETEREAAAEKLPENEGNLLSILVKPAVLTYILIYLTFDLAYWGCSSWLPTYLIKARNFSMLEMGIIASLPAFAGTVGCIAGGRLSDRYFPNRRHIPVIVCQLVSAVFLLMIYTAQTTTALVTYQLLGGFFLMGFFGVFWALPMNAIASRYIGVAAGAINMAGQVAAFIAPLIIGRLVDVSGGDFRTTFGFFVICLLVSAGLVATTSVSAVVRGPAALRR